MEAKTKSLRINRNTIVIGFLILVCLVQASFIIYLLSPGQSIFQSPDSFTSFINKQFKKEIKNHWDRFDLFFNDDFFRNESDPFAEMHLFHQKMEKVMEEAHKPSFRNSWDSWFDSRFSHYDDKVDVQVSETKDSYIVTLIMPAGLKDNELKIDIGQDGISIDGDFTKILEKKDTNGNIIARSETKQSISQEFPLPEDADYKNAIVDQMKSKTIITLPKLKLS